MYPIYIHTHIHVYIHTYSHVHVYIGKQSIHRLGDQYGGQTHRHPPGEGQLDLRNFVLPSILAGSFFQQTSSQRREWRRDGSARFRTWDGVAYTGNVLIARDLFFSHGDACSKRSIARTDDWANRKQWSAVALAYLVLRLSFWRKRGKNTVSKRPPLKLWQTNSRQSKAPDEREENKNLYRERYFSIRRIKSIARCARTIDGGWKGDKRIGV